MKNTNGLIKLIIWDVIFYSVFQVFYYGTHHIGILEIGIGYEITRMILIIMYCYSWIIMSRIIDDKKINTYLIVVLILVPSFFFGTLRLQYYLVDYLPIVMHWMNGYLLNNIDVLSTSSFAIFVLTTMKLLNRNS